MRALKLLSLSALFLVFCPVYGQDPTKLNSDGLLTGLWGHYRPDAR
jgi:hypothetical protein